jgi:hypothetical protein
MVMAAIAKAERPKMRFIVVSAPKDGDEGERGFGIVGVGVGRRVVDEVGKMFDEGRRIEVEEEFARAE